MPNPPTPRTDSTRYSISMVPTGSAFGYCGAAGAKAEPPAGPGGQWDYTNHTRRREWTPHDERLLPPCPPVPFELSAAVRRAAGRGHAGRGARARAARPAHHRLRDGGLRVRAA